jgi:putative ABC transport system permease protein
MNSFSLSYAYIRANWLTNTLLVALLAIGVATIGLLLHFSNKAEERLTRDARGFDLVVGAKGSPLQLVLSSIYHMDIPTGNMSFEDAEKMRKNPQVKQAIPLALGDNFQGYRIVGTEPTYVFHYNGEFATGVMFDHSFEAVLGSQVAAETRLGLNGAFSGSHGLTVSSSEHANSQYKVVGVLNPTGTVLDRLILTPVESVWEVHGGAAHEDHEAKPDDHAHETGAEAHADEAKPDDHAHEAGAEAHADEAKPDDHAHEAGADAHADEAKPDDHGHEAKSEGKGEITALLISLKTKAAALSMPREINRQTALQAASPAFESARLFSLLGLGLDTLRLFGGVLIGSAVLGMLVALFQSMQARKVDLSLMRALGASKFTLLKQIIVETGLLLVAGLLAGLALCHLALLVLPKFIPQLRDFGMGPFQFLPSEFMMLAGLLISGLIVALIPALTAYRTDVSKTLARA